VENIHTFYERVEALKGISFTVEQGEIVTLIGSNGAGKSTILKTISGIVRSREGRISFQGKDITGAESHDIVSSGLAQVPEGRRVFSVLTVEENLDMGAFTRSNSSEVAESKERIFNTFPIIKERRKQLAGTLSGGEQQMLAIGRALMAKPKLLMLDEPSLGLAPMIVRDIFRIIREINEEQGVSILLVEQNARLSLKVATRGYVLERGEIAVSGPSKQLLENTEVQEAFLGKAHAPR
jgi:branched-chain amino acid transport system ATP-binding protein